MNYSSEGKKKLILELYRYLQGCHAIRDLIKNLIRTRKSDVLRQ